jgi:cytochrome c
MARRSSWVLGFLGAALGCNQAPPVPENPPLVGAPNFGPTVLQDVAPPPVSGGTMWLSLDGTTAVVSDPDRDFVSLVDIAKATVRAQVALSAHDEPGRIVEDGAGQVHVALRGAGSVATISLATGQLVARQAVCAEPRGVAYDSVNDQVLVACATGELVTLPAASGPPVQVVTIEPGLRDVVIDGDSVFVSKFRTAEILQLTRSGTIVARTFLPNGSFGGPIPVAPSGPNSTPSSPLGVAQASGSVALAWRIRLTSDHQIMAAYESDSTSFVPTTPGGYGGSSPPIVQTSVASVSTADLTTNMVSASVNGIVLPVDIAVPPAGSANGSAALIVAAANWKSPATPAYASLASGGGTSGNPAAVPGQIIAAEIGSDGTIFLQSREPAALYLVTPNASTGPSCTQCGQADTIRQTISLSGVSREDTGHTIFHTNSGGSLACASCHGEGGEDAQTWNFNGTKPRRTPSLLGTVKGTEPYHWDADFPDMEALVQNVYTGRMSGPELAADQLAALKGWVEQLPPPKGPAVDPAAQARGQALFAGAAACATCHSGPSFTNNATVDVGTGGPLQVPPLVGVGARLPLLHTGCATTLTERFTKCATSAHGATSTLTTDEIGDLVAFLQSL